MGKYHDWKRKEFIKGGSCHAISKSHLPRYLAEYCVRFNNRFNLRQLLPKIALAAINTPPMPYRLLKLAEPSG